MSGVVMFRKEDPSSAMNTLSLFNQQVLHYQDDAYTLARYLLGDDAVAEAVMQNAVQVTFHSIHPIEKTVICRSSGRL
jgi:DNA-directed RNA polymerase specialized sigma24 family protein